MTDEEVVWKRFCFHAPYIYRADIPFISDPILFKREQDFMREFDERRHEPDSFRKYKFEGFSVAYSLKQMKHKPLSFILLLLLSVIFGVPFSLILLLKVNPLFKVAVTAGTILNLTVDCFIRIVFNISLYGLILASFTGQ